MVSVAMARCLAYVSADGYLSTKYIRYSTTCKALREEFKNDLLQEFGALHITEGNSSSGTPFVQVQRKHVIVVFLQHMSDFRSSSVHIPTSVLRSSDDVRQQFMRALYDDEGCVALRLSKRQEWKRSITLTSNSFKLLAQASTLLMAWGIQPNAIIRTNAQARDKSYVLAITGKENILRYGREVGFMHPRKVRMLEFMIRSFYATSKSKDRFNALQSELVAFREEKKGGQLSQVPARKSSTAGNVGALDF
jgi:intein/homing endonuclease